MKYVSVRWIFIPKDPRKIPVIPSGGTPLQDRRGAVPFRGSGKGLFVVIRGKIRAFQQDEDGREQVMHVDAAGAVLGDVPVFDDGPYPASAISEVDADVLL
jgi:CRP/FNR family transcriptional regulator